MSALILELLEREAELEEVCYTVGYLRAKWDEANRGFRNGYAPDSSEHAGYKAYMAAAELRGRLK